MLDPLKQKLLDQALQALRYVLRTKGRSLTVADLDAAFVALGQRSLDETQPTNEVDREHGVAHEASRPPARVRISPTIAADYQARHVFPELRPPNGEPPGSYFIDHPVSRRIAQAVYDDAVEQAARGGSLERRSLTLAYNALARRARLNFGSDWFGLESDADRRDPGDFRAQAPVVDALLRTASQMPNQKP